jgi:hypothetical protein
MYCLGFPTLQAYADACYKIYDNEIGYMFSRQFTMMGGDLGTAFWLMYTDPTKTLTDIEEIAKKPETAKLADEMRYSFHLMLGGRSLRDIEFQDKVLEEILAHTGGWKITKLCEQELAEFTYLFLHRAGQRAVAHAYAGGWAANWAIPGSPDYVIKYQPAILEAATRDQGSGKIVQCGGDTTVGAGSSMGGGGVTGFEELAFFDPADKESVVAAKKFMYDGLKDQKEHGFPPGRQLMYLQVGMTDHQIHGYYSRANQPLVYHLQRKIKQLMDPNDVGDRLYAYLPERENGDPLVGGT